MKKIFLSFIILLVVVVVVAAMVIGFSLNNIIKSGVETVGSKMMQVSVQVDTVNLALLSGSASIKGLEIGNPSGYTTPQAISVGSAAVGLNPFSILSDKIVVRSVQIEAPEITFEGNPFSGNNLGKIMQNVNAGAKKTRPVVATNTVAGTNNPSARKIEVDDFMIASAKVHVTLTAGGGLAARKMDLTLPTIHLTDLGTNSDGITTAELTRRVLEAITTATVKVVANSATDIGTLPRNLGNSLGKSLNIGVTNLPKSLGGFLNQSTN